MTDHPLTPEATRRPLVANPGAHMPGVSPDLPAVSRSMGDALAATMCRAELAEARVEIERLRAALHHIAHGEHGDVHYQRQEALAALVG